jgi:outer membrane protein OmpA-like peptidoglycan-associated protein/polyisoprenoid-binding protein YceI
MHIIRTRVYLAVALLALMIGMHPATAQNLLNQDWVLNSSQSNVYMQTEKLENTIEKHRFTSVEGNVSKDGDATIKIDLNTLDTGIDLRNVRMRFVLFETFKFLNAIITARIDKSKLTELATRSRISYTLMAKVNLHGIVRDIQIPVEISRVNDTTVTVSTIKPVDVSAETFDFMKGISKLSDAMGGIRIVPAASITFDLTFSTGSARPALEAARAERERVKAQEAAVAISTEGCETRFAVISESNAIYFKTGKAELEADEPLLDTGANIAKRCPSVHFRVDGHTDNVGGRRFNQRLSELRAKSVVEYLAAKGVSASRIQSAGYGENHPVAPNDNETNRAKNRRIQFTVDKN